jgi:hypothetical protein
MKPEFKISEVTGLYEATIRGKLTSISEKVLQNSNGKNFRVGGFEVVNYATGEVKPFSALIYEGNYSKGMHVGTTYQAKVTIMEDGSPLITVSHLTPAERATADDFGFVVSKASVLSAKM